MSVEWNSTGWHSPPFVKQTNLRRSRRQQRSWRWIMAIELNWTELLNFHYCFFFAAALLHSPIVSSLFFYMIINFSLSLSTRHNTVTSKLTNDDLTSSQQKKFQWFAWKMTQLSTRRGKSWATRWNIDRRVISVAIIDMFTMLLLLSE